MYVPTCNFGPHFWPKKKHLFYVRWGRGLDFKRSRLRFCAEHAAIVDEYLSQFEIGPVEAASRRLDDGVVYCLACCEPIHQIGWEVFITGYPAQDERKDYWGGLHIEHQLPDYLREPVKGSPDA